MQAYIFDLDGVLTDTAALHFAAWRRLAAELGIRLDAQVHEALKGVDRAASLDIVLALRTRRYSPQEKEELARRKNVFYIDSLRDLSPADVLPGALDALAACRRHGSRCALASSSRNARHVIERLGIGDAFDVVVDGTAVLRAKPHPEIFLHAARLLNVPAGTCIGVEDSVAGIQSIKAAGMHAVGIGNATVLEPAGADFVIDNIGGFATLVERFASGQGSDIGTAQDHLMCRR